MINQNDNESLQKLYKLVNEEPEKLPAAPEESNILSPEEFHLFEQRLLRCKSNLYRNHPFFGLILTRLHTVPTQDDRNCPTMGVDNCGNIYINPKFMGKLSFPEVIGVLAHECFHIANLTFFRKGNRDHKMWNVATDFAMNRDLLEMGMTLPKNGCIPINEGGKWFIDINEEGIPPLKVEITELTCEEIYDALKPILDEQNKKMKEFLEALSEAMDKLFEDGKGQPGDKKGEGGTPIPCNVPGGDPTYSPDKKEGTSDSQKENDLKNLISSALQEAARSGAAGGIPRSFNQNILQPKTNWKALLKNFVITSSRTEYDWGRPAKRALASGYYNPKSVQIKGKIDILVAIDTSGSISDDMIMSFNSELMKIVRSFPQVKIKLLYWHTEVYADIDLNSALKSAEQLQKELLQINHVSGGTTFSCVKQYIDTKHYTDIKGLVVFTDGYIESTPQVPNIKKKLFLIIDKGDDSILKKYGPTYKIDVLHS